MAPEFEVERNIVAQGNQLVLTDFSNVDLLAFYDLERLAYEVWRTSAALRTTGKGAPLVVSDAPECFGDGRSQELDSLVRTYDERLDRSSLSHSASGVIFSGDADMSASGYVLLPIYNVGGVAGKVTGNDYQQFMGTMYGVRIAPETTYNFAWIPFNLRDYRKAHSPFAGAFYEKYRVSLDAVLAVVAALLTSVTCAWQEGGVAAFTRFHQRAYEGPCHKEVLRERVSYFLPAACHILGMGESLMTPDAIEHAMRFWELDVSSAKGIDLAYSGPHCLFLPVQPDQFFVDYAWILRRLHDLFVGVWLPDQNFKGDTLEKAVRKGKSVLPTKPCIARSGEQRQIDYAVACGSHLVIAECKAVGMSIAFERGDPTAIKHRTDNVVELALTQVDQKAKWLAEHPAGTNYDIGAYDYILPVVVSPFVEFVPSQDKRYWVSGGIPRVLTPEEFEGLVNDPANVANAFNRISLR
ncbi:MAG: hypothetical protein SVP26_10605 [Chloroflexota bacterium]|nr:hypothetical protein [Chloroflexota bacterium]